MEEMNLYITQILTILKNVDKQMDKLFENNTISQNENYKKRCVVLYDMMGRDTPLQKHLRQLCQSVSFTECAFKRTPIDYYDWTLTQRQKLLQTPGTNYLCKSIVMTNTHCTVDNCNDPNNSLHYLVILQYTTKLNSEKLKKFARDQNLNKIGKRHFNFRLAPESIAFELSGYKHNAICPIGMKTKIPIIMCKKITDLSYIWLGGGEIDVKWKVIVKEFINVFNPFIADITDD